MDDERVSGSGVELLAIYGEEDERMGRWFSRRGRRRRKRRFLKISKKALKLSPHYWAYRGAKKITRRRRRRLRGEEEDRFSGEDVEFLGLPEEAAKYEEIEMLGGRKKRRKKKRRFLPGLRKIGKFTRKITTGAAQFVGVPKPLLSALAKIDPTKGKKASVQKAIAELQKPATVPATQAGMMPLHAGMFELNKKNIAIVAASGLGLLLVSKVLSSAPRRSDYSR